MLPSTTYIVSIGESNEFVVVCHSSLTQHWSRNVSQRASYNMRVTSRLLAAAATTGNGLRPAPMAILPPIPLYRRLLRAHRKFLPADMRVLGDIYVKSEFRLHRNVDNPAHLVNNAFILGKPWEFTFLSSWKYNQLIWIKINSSSAVHVTNIHGSSRSASSPSGSCMPRL